MTYVLSCAVLLLFFLRSRDRDRLDELEALLADTTRVATPAPVPIPVPTAAPVYTAPVPVPAPVPVAAPVRVERPAPVRRAPEPELKPSPAYAVTGPSGPSAVARLRGWTIQGRTLESLLAEHALAIVGGLFVFVAAVLFLTFAIGAGWIGEAARMWLAGTFGAALVGAGVWNARRLPAMERQGRAIGSLHGVLAGTGIAVLFVTVVATVRRYELIGATPGTVLALVVGAVAVALAHRWRSQDLAAFGLVGALAAPVLVDAPASGATLPLLVVALIAAVGTALVERWPRLLFVASIVTAPQLAAWADGTTAGAATFLLVLGAWWTILAGAALVAHLRSSVARGDSSRSIVGVLFTTSLATPGLFEIWAEGTNDGHLRVYVLGGLALVHLVVGLVLLRRDRERHAGFGVAALTLAAATATAAVSAGTGGAVVAASWLAEAVGMSALWWLVRDKRAALASVVLGVMAIVHVVSEEDTIRRTWSAGDGDWQALAAVAALGCAAVAASFVARLAAPERAAEASVVRRVLEVLTWVAGVTFGSIAITALVQHGARIDGDVARLAITTWLGGCAVVLAARSERRSRPELLGLAIVAGIASVEALAWSGRIDTAAGLVPHALVATFAAALTRIRRGQLTWFAGLVAAAVATAQALSVAARLDDLVLGRSEELGQALGALAVVLAVGALLRLTARALPDDSSEVHVVRDAVDVALAGLVALLALAPVQELALREGLHSGPGSWMDTGVPGALTVILVAVLTTALARRVRHEPLEAAGAVLVVLGAAVLASGVEVDGLTISVVLGAAAAAVFGICRTPVARVAGALLVAAQALAVLVEVPPSSLVTGVEGSVVAAALTVGALLVPVVALVWRPIAATRAWALAAAGLVALLTVSVAVVGAFTTELGEVESDAQVALSITWALIGVAIVGLGMARVERGQSLRIAGYALLGVAAAKVVLFDTSTLETPFRVLAFLAVGLLLLVAAWLEQRMRRPAA